MILATCAALAAQGGSQVPYPEGYREWTHVKSMVIQKGHPLFDAFGGLHHIYANPAAAEALRASVGCGAARTEPSLTPPTTPVILT